MAATKQKSEVKAAAKKSAPRSAAHPVTIAKKRSSEVSKSSKSVVSKSAKAKIVVSELVTDSVATTPKGKVRALPRLTPDLMQLICTRIANGEAAYKVLKHPDIKIDDSDFYARIRDDDVYSKMYRDAMERRGEKFADELTELADEARHGTHEDIQALKLMVNTRQWIVSRLLPKKYGEKVIVAGDADNPLVTQLVVNSGDILKKIKNGD